MKLINRAHLLLLLFMVPIANAWAEEDRYQETIATFKGAGESGDFFSKSYAYAVFPTIEIGRAHV